MSTNAGASTTFAVMLLPAMLANIGTLAILAIAFLLIVRTNAAALAQFAVTLAFVV
jgi:hypothetical protein